MKTANPVHPLITPSVHNEFTFQQNSAVRVRFMVRLLRRLGLPGSSKRPQGKGIHMETNPLFESRLQAAGAHTNPFVKSNLSSSAIQSPASATTAGIQDSDLRVKGQLAMAKKWASKQIPGHPMPDWCRPKLPPTLEESTDTPKVGIDPKPSWLQSASRGGLDPKAMWPIGLAAG